MFAVVIVVAHALEPPVLPGTTAQALGRRRVLATTSLLVPFPLRAEEQIIVDAEGKQVGKAERRTTPPPLDYNCEDISSQVFRRSDWSAEPAFTKDDFRRLDESDDKNFYTEPRLVYHIDEAAVFALTNYYEKILPGKKVLDVCSSWVSHFPKDVKGTGVGMNDFELRNNLQLDNYVVQNLNLDPNLPFPDNSFDAATIVVSVDYLTRPIDVLREIRRVLKKPHGRLLISQSNRLFLTKAIAMWIKSGDYDHLDLIGQYLRYAGFPDAKVHAFDITATTKGSFFLGLGGLKSKGDPLFMVDAQAG